MDTTSSNKVSLNLRTLSYWDDDDRDYVDRPIGYTGVLYEIDGLVEHMIDMHSDLHDLDPRMVKEVGEIYIERALEEYFPVYKVDRIVDLLNTALGSDVMAGVDVKHDGREYGIEITYTDEAVEKLQDLCSDYEGYDLAAQTMQALVDSVASTRESFSLIIDNAWGYVDEAFDEEIKKAEEDEEDEEDEETDLVEEARKLSELGRQTFVDCLDTLERYVDINQFTPQQISDLLDAMYASGRYGYDQAWREFGPRRNDNE